jgi:outer membrane protein OmpA-like peptidoglycan-associated protein
METPPLSAHVTSRLWLLGRTLTPALLLTLVPLGTAIAQPPPYENVRITKDDTEIECFAKKHETCLTASQGTILEVLYIEGDRYAHRNSNWYWVLLPADQWGRRVTGWLPGDVVTHVAPVVRAATSPTNLTATPAATNANAMNAGSDTMTVTTGAETAAARAVLSDVVLNFEFDKSSLTDEALQKLQSAVAWTTTPGQGIVSVALSGHADGIGREAYNDRLGSARAETVKKYLTEQLGIPAESIRVTSYGERQPIAPNKTRSGRAQNRRVELKAGGS